MEIQRWACVIDLFGYDGTLPYIMLVCDEPWLSLFAVAPPNSPAVEASDRPGRASLTVSLTAGSTSSRAELVFLLPEQGPKSAEYRVGVL